ncbi:MAG: MATE family efflux transporter [Methanosarcina sp.]|uniref:MATE family efflux transporter n=1 Tax=Methanosarcina sp. TaxID=2213 RepID=UPI00260A647E|nr:MATE family efflux transporter [Methanosarcina sp.]MDD3246347.1 MATE family efflux transporter [Methanosarcina sp.]
MDEKSEFLGTESIRKLLFKLSTPVIIGMLVQALYNVVDTLFVGWAYGAESVQAIGGLSIAFPVQMIIMAFGIILGTGGSSIISRALGARETERAEKVLGNVFSLSLILSVLIAIPCLLYLDPILKAFGSTPGILPYARDYLEIIIAGGIVFVFGISVQNIVRAEGNARLAMNAMLIGGGLNILLDPLFIFGFGMGVQGAAIATVLSQSVGSAWLLQYCLKGKGAVRFKAETLKLSPGIIKEIGAIGLGSFVMEASGSVMMIFVYNALASYGGDVAIAVFGITMKINSFIFLPLLGMSFGLQPIVGFNYGAKQFGRIVEAVKLSLAATTAFGLLGLLVISLFPEQLLGLFSADPEYLTVGKSAVVIMVLGLPLIGCNVVTTTLFQALGQAKPSFLLSISRQLLFLIPLVIILPRLYGLAGVWAAFPASDLLSFLLSGLMLLRVYRSFKKRTGVSKIGIGAEMAISSRLE